MSADNGVYILVTKRNRVCEEISRMGVTGKCWGAHKHHLVYRVAHASAIDNFEDYKQREPYNLGAYMKDIWGASRVFLDKNQALEHAHKMADGIEVLEYGVSVIDASDMVFYGDM